MPVGSGGMACVWAARHRGTHVIHALKMLRPHLAENVSFREMFFDEARIASRIRHENVCGTFELVELEGILTLVMEWVDGSSLVRMLRPGPPNERNPRVALPIRHAVKILAEACAGLHAAHELADGEGRSLSVVHRDVSPHNILLTLDGRVKVTDFGVAKALGKMHMTIAGQLKGKLAYMSPEQLVGGGIDRRSDVFALGNVLYETTTGERPFRGEHDPQLMAAIIMGNFEPPSAVVRDYPPALENIVMRALAIEPEARYSTALQLRRALEEWLAVSGPPVGPPQIAQLLYERCGEEINDRAAGVMPLPPPPAISSARLESSSSAMEVDRRSVPSNEAPQGMSMLAGVLAVLVGLMLGLCVLFYVRTARREHAEAVASISLAADAAAPIVVIADAAIRTDERVEGAPAPGSNELAQVALQVPQGAQLFVDGQPLPPGTVTIPRPDAGSIHILVKADGRQDTMVVVEPDSPDTLEVTMPRKKPRAPAPTVPPPNPYE